MKNLVQVQQQIADNIRFASRKDISERDYKKITKETEQLRTIEKYLETNPSEAYLISEKKRLEGIIKAKNDQYEYWFNHNKPFEVDQKDARSFFNKENGLNALNRQLKMLDMILD